MAAQNGVWDDNTGFRLLSPTVCASRRVSRVTGVGDVCMDQGYRYRAPLRASFDIFAVLDMHRLEIVCFGTSTNYGIFRF